MILSLSKYDDLYLEQLKTGIANSYLRIPCPHSGYCDSNCGLRQFCELLKAAYEDVCQEESKRNATKP